MRQVSPLCDSGSYCKKWLCFNKNFFFSRHLYKLDGCWTVSSNKRIPFCAFFLFFCGWMLNSKFQQKDSILRLFSLLWISFYHFLWESNFMYWHVIHCPLDCECHYQPGLSSRPCMHMVCPFKKWVLVHQLPRILFL